MLELEDIKKSEESKSNPKAKGLDDQKNSRNEEKPAKKASGIRSPQQQKPISSGMNLLITSEAKDKLIQDKEY